MTCECAHVNVNCMLCACVHVLCECAHVFVNCMLCACVHVLCDCAHVFVYSVNVLMCLYVV